MDFFTFVTYAYVKQIRIRQKTICQQSSNKFEISIVKMAQKCCQIKNRNIFSMENPFFEDCCFGRLLTDGFFRLFWTVLQVSMSQK